MKYLLDTNFLSELVKPTANPGALRWLASVAETDTCLSVATWAELRHGAERLPAGARRQRLGRWLGEDLPRRFSNRILPVDVAIADAWGTLVARREAAGHPIEVMDALIAGTAAVHRLALVTRNTADFLGCGVELVNPWT